jgi:hypothetical protein
VKHSVLISFALIAASALLPGCASIVSKSTRSVYVRTDPKGADVSITDKKGIEVFKGKSPATVTLKSGAGFFSKAGYQVKISAPGYSEKIIPINYTINGWYFGNIIFGGLIGMLIVDPATGAMWTVKDPVVEETLVRIAGSTSAVNNEPTLNIVNIHEISKEAQSKLMRLK